ncbi:MAG: enoyl-CoA hydratase-related protein, partial [Deltaproteobacteria bacterium]|nr:enoyl-CoA hydratase-related protein [Deltaproteobacteria bacterium]
MIFNGKYLQAKFTQPGIAEIVYDTQGESVNTIDPAWGDELSQVLDKLSQEKKMLGAYLISGKNDFCMGANIKGFLPSFQQGPQVVEDYVMQVHGLFNRLEDLPFPTVAAVHGYCLGGGMEVSMAFTYRVAAVGTRFSQAEVKLGLIPGFGGCVRLPRLIGADHAIELIATGRNMAAEEALKKHLVSAVVAPESLAAAAAGLIQSVQAD